LLQLSRMPNANTVLWAGFVIKAALLMSTVVLVATHAR
jgi:hypothetical protein